MRLFIIRIDHLNLHHALNCPFTTVLPFGEKAARLAERIIQSTPITLLLSIALSLAAPITRSAPAQTPSAPSETAAYFEDLRGHSRYHRERERSTRTARNRIIRSDTSRATPVYTRSEITRGQRTSRDARRAAYYQAARTSARRPTDRRSRGNDGAASLERLITERLIHARLHRDTISHQESTAPTHRDARVRNARYTGHESPGGRVATGVPGRRGNFGAFTSDRIRPSYFSRGSFGGEDRANVRIGPVDVRVGTSTFSEYNDNILRSGTEKLSDVIVGQTLDLHARWQLSDRNSIDLRVGAGIERYLQHHDRAPTSQDGYDIYVTPDSSLSYDVFLGDMVLNIHDRFSIENRGRDDFELDDVQVIDSYSNAAGAALFIPLSSRFDVSIGYDYVINRGLDDRAEATSSNSHQFFADAGYSPGGVWRLGLQASGASTDYLDAARGDARTTNVGAYIELPLTRFTTIRASGGHQSIQIAEVDGASGNYTGTYGQVSIANQLNRSITQNLSFGRQADLGSFSDIRITHSAQYRIYYRGRDGDELHLSASYEMNDDRGDSVARSERLGNSLPVIEDRSDFSTRLFYRRPLSRNLRASIGGGYSHSTSGVAGRNYSRWTAGAELQYALSDTLSTGIGFTHTTVEAPDSQGYSQNRVLFNLNYLF